ncbi:hypothetical protein ACLOJK_035489 [Asimina triloba]
MIRNSPLQLQQRKLGYRNQQPSLLENVFQKKENKESSFMGHEIQGLRKRGVKKVASKGCIKKDKVFLNKFIMSERKFLDECVMRYQSRVPDVLQIYKDPVGSKGMNAREMRHLSKVP